MAESPQPITSSRSLPLLAPYLPSDLVPYADPNRPGVIMGGIRSGLKQAVGAVGSAIAAGGSAFGSPTVQSAGEQIADRLNAEAQQVGRPDLEGSPFAAPTYGGVGQRLLYQTAKMVPTLGAIALSTAAAPEAAIPAGLARAGAMLPRFLGGAGGLAGLGEAETAAALATGRTAAARIGAGAAVMAPQNIAGMYEQERESPGGVTQGKSLAALGMAAPLSLATAVAPASFLGGKFEGSFLGRAAGGAFTGAAANAVGSGLSAAADISFRPDIPLADKMHTIVDSVASGAALGGLLGGALGGLHKIDPVKMSTDEIKAKTDLLVPESDQAAPSATDQAVSPGVEVTRQPDTGLPGQKEPSGLDAVLSAQARDPYAGLSTEELAEVQKITQTKAEDLTARAERNLGIQPKAEEAKAALAEVDQAVKARALSEGPDKLPEQGAFPEPAQTTPEVPAGPPTLQDRIKGAYEALTDNGKAVDTAAIRAALPDVKPSALTTAFKAMNDDEGTDAKLETKPGSALTPEDKAGAVKYKKGDTYHQLWIPEEERLNAVREPGAEGVLSPELAKVGGRVGEGNAERNAVAQETVPGQDHVTPQEAQTNLLPGGLRPADPRFAGLDADKLDLQARIAQHTMNGKTVAMKQLPEAAPRAEGSPTISAVLPEDVATEHQALAQQTDAMLRDQGNMSPAKRERVELAAADIAAGNPDSARAEVDQFDAPVGKVADGAKTSSILPEEFDAAFAKATGHLNPESLAKVAAVETYRDLPADALAALSRQGMHPEDYVGLNYRGVSYIIKDKVKRAADVQDTIFHEHLHGVLKESLGATHSTVMSYIFGEAGGVDGILKIADKYGVGDELRRYTEDMVDPANPTSQEASRFADEMFVQAGSRNIGKLSLALREWAGKIKLATLDAMRKLGMDELADRWSKFSALDTAVMLGKMRDAVPPEGVETPMSREIAFKRTPDGANFDSERGTGIIDKIMSGVKNIPYLEDAGTVMKRLNVASMGLTDTAALYGVRIPELRDLKAVSDNERFIQDTAGRLLEPQSRALKDLSNQYKGADASLSRLRDFAVSGVDALRTVSQHTELTDAERISMAPRIRAANAELSRLGQITEGKGRTVYENAVSNGEFSRYMNVAVLLDKLVPEANPELKSAISAAEAYHANTAIHADIKASTEFAKGLLQDHIARMNDVLDKLPVGQALELRELAKIGANALKAQTPYFSLARSTGEHFLSFDIRSDESGKDAFPDTKAMDAIAAGFEKAGFKNVTFNQGLANSRAFIRFESQQQLDNARTLVQGLGKQGYLDPTSIASGLRGDTAAKAIAASGAKISPQIEILIKRTAARREAEMPDDLSPEAQAQYDLATKAAVKLMQTVLTDMIPDQSIKNSQQKRMGVQGYNKDMVEALARSGQATAKNIAYVSQSEARSAAIAGMHERIREANKDDTISINQKVMMARVVQEQALRSAQRVIAPQGGGASDLIAGGLHSYYTFGSVGYMAKALSQPYVLGQPELAKYTSQVNAAKDLGGGTLPAFKLMYKVAQLANRSSGVVTQEAIKNSGLSVRDQELATQAVNRGLNAETFSRMMFSYVNTGKAGWAKNALQMSGVASVYAETMSRLIMVFAAGRTYDRIKNPAMSLNDFVYKVGQESLFPWGHDETGRLFGKQGYTGTAGKLEHTFTGYQTKYAAKLYRELYLAFGTHPDPEMRADARKFLLAHMAATTVIAGSMGLPAAGWVAGAANQVTAAINGGEGIDIGKSYRDFLTAGMGQDASDVIAFGLPRLLGVDLRLHEEGGATLPFGPTALFNPLEKLLNDRRSLKESLPDMAVNALGAPNSFASNLLEAGGNMMHGDTLHAIEAMLPRGLRDVGKAYELSTRGYHDASGRAMPLTPDAVDILAQALGFAQAGISRVHEQTRDIKGDIAAKKVRSGYIKQNFYRALEQGDVAAQHEGLAQVASYNQDHPTTPINLGQYVTQRKQQEQVAHVTGVAPDISLKNYFSVTQ